jgi:ribosomal peptide maturation radical SAM protein 1
MNVQAAVSPPQNICLIAMPFLPILSPSLGLSQLKSELTAHGVDCDVSYPSLDFFARMVDLADLDTATLDYKFIASSTDIGETLFAASLWDRPDLEDRAAEVVSSLLNAADKAVDRRYVEQAVARLLMLPSMATAFIDDLASARDWGRYDVIGFSTVFSQTTASLALARRIKARWPGTTILFGGPNVDGDMGLAMMRSFSFVDVVLRGEADLTLPRFMQAPDIASRAAIRGVVLRQGDKIVEGPPATPVMNLDQRPIPDFADYFTSAEAILGPGLTADRITLPIETSRGCWWGAVKHCVFCGLNPTTMEFRSKSAGRALSEFDLLAERWGIKQFFAVDNIIDMRYFRQLLPLLAGRDYSIFYETKSNLKEAHVEALARAGVTSIQPGLEGLHSETLRLMDKGVKGRQNIELLKWCRLYGVDPLWFYLYGFPKERAEPYLRDIALMPLLWHLPAPRNPNPIVLDRYSPLFRDRESLGLTPLIPSSNAEIYFAGLAPEARIALGYHFENRASLETIGRYEGLLWQAILLWRKRHSDGAFLCHLRGETTTLVLDGRSSTRTMAYLLVGAAHTLLHELRCARPLATLTLADSDGAGANDIGLTMAAAALGAEFIQCNDAEAAWSCLEERGLAVLIDDCALSLTVDLTAGAVATSLGLENLVKAPRPVPLDANA